MKENRRSAAVFYRKYGIALILIILFVASALVNHNFLKPRNLINILTQISGYDHCMRRGNVDCVRTD